MKLHFVDLDRDFKLVATPSISCTPDGTTVNTFSATIEGAMDLGEDQVLTGEFRWESDNGDAVLRVMAVEDFNHYDLNEITDQPPITYHEDEDGNQVQDPIPEDWTPTVLRTSLYFTTSERIIPPEPPEYIPPTPEEIMAQERPRVIAQITAMRDQCIEMGIDVTTQYGDEHFPLAERDKTMLLAIYAMVQGGMTQFPYHSLGAQDVSNICVVYSDEDIGKIAVAAFSFVTFHESYANMLVQWLERVDDLEEFHSIRYGADLPEDLQNYLLMIMVSAAGTSDQKAVAEMMPNNMPWKGSDILLPGMVRPSEDETVEDETPAEELPLE